MIERKKNLKSRKNVISKENAKNKPSMAEKSKLNNQVLAIIIFAVAVLFACLVFIKAYKKTQQIDLIIKSLHRHFFFCIILYGGFLE